jgi:hypothetical protein
MTDEDTQQSAHGLTVGDFVPLSALNEPIPAAARLRAFEDTHLGPNAPRVAGLLERGHGSLYVRLTDVQRAEHAALERLVKAEQAVADASAKLAEAEAEHGKALVAADGFKAEPDGIAE